MNVINIISNVFCDYSNYESIDNSLSEHISALNLFVDKKLASQSFDLPVDRNEGRLGPSITVFDVDTENDNTVKISKDHLTLQSQSAFSTVRANSCVFGGKWMYEVQLRSKGVMQIGFCSHACKFTQDTGVGDTRHSYGLDGSKQRIWHVYTKKYGPYWRSGDIFGVCVDLDKGIIEYYRNGVSLGEAFRNLERGPGLALYPAVSLAYNDSLTANFGGSPFKHPIKIYRSFQEAPLNMLFKADCLLQYLVNLARVISRHKPASAYNGTSTSAGTDSVSNETVFMLIGSMLVEKCAPLLTNSYVVEDKVFSYIRSMCVLRSNSDKESPIQPGSQESTLGSFLTILWTYMELEEMQLFMKKLVNFLANTYRETPVDLEYEKQRMIIVILSCICNHPQTRKYLLQFKLFTKNCLPLFLYTKPPDESTLEQLLPDDHIWTEGLGGSKENYIVACNKLQSCTITLYTLQKNLINTLLNNQDGCEHTPSSRKIFMKNLRKFVMENSLEHRGNTSSPTQPAVGLSFLCVLLDVAKQLWTDETNSNVVFIDSINFCDGTFTYNNIDRIGGLLSHLKKTYRNQLGTFLGHDHPVMTNDSYEQIQSDFQDIYAAMFLITGTSSSNISGLADENNEPAAQPASNSNDTKKLTPGNMDERRSICELIDCSILFYYAVAHKYVVMIADLRDNIAHLSEILIETKNSCDEVFKKLSELNSCANGKDGNSFQSTHDAILDELSEKFGQRKNIFAKRSIEFARKQAWYRSVALGTQRRKLLCWLLEVIFNTLSNTSKRGVLFGFIPETYLNILPILLDTVLDFSFHDTGIQHNLSGIADLVNASGEFLGQHLADPRVVLASCKDSLIQAIGALTCHQKGIQALEQASEKSQTLLVEALLRPYENRAWGQSNWLLLRFWLGEGFAFRESRPPCIWQGGQSGHTLGLYRSRSKSGSSGLLHLIAPACPSRHFQYLIGNMLANDEPFCTKFLNSLLSQLNWGFSEFIHILQDIQNTTQREEQQPIDSKQLKIGAMCFELTVSLMRALEMILSIVPSIFLDQSRPNSDILLGRICQLVIQVMSRVTLPPGCFQHVIDLCLPDLTYVTHFSIITAAIGILLALMKNELNMEENIFKIPKISRIILTDPSFQIAHLQFALGIAEQTTSLVAIPRGNFDPQMRANIDPLTNECRSSPKRAASGREIIPDPPIIKFNLRDYPSHVSEDEMLRVRNMIRILEKRQTLLSEITILSEDTLCSICYAKQNSATFEPCHHQSCDNCIIQHLMSNKCCFYCKIHITMVCKFDGTTVYESQPPPIPPSVSGLDDDNDDNDDYNDDESIV